MKILRAVVDGIDWINEWIGRIFKFLLIPLLVVSMYEVIARYLFNSPTVWAAQILSLIFVALVVIGGGHVLRQDGHVRMDVFYGRLSPRGRAISDLCTFIVFLIFTTLLAWQTIDMAMESVKIREASWSAFKGPIYPKKIALALGVCLLWLQGIVKLTKDIRTLKNKKNGRDDNGN
ncbi:MAG: TRAP transporter small permease subunit [Deltaproteobacteria bacterium]|nr:TRAP transporter small permease subunit [Deltaproteobacteria bacterium]